MVQRIDGYIFLILSVLIFSLGFLTHAGLAYFGKTYGIRDIVESGEFQGIKIKTYVPQNPPNEIKNISTSVLLGWKAFYREVDKTIYVNKAILDDGKITIGDLYHEEGHHVWFNVITEEDRKDYIQIVINYGEFVSEYSYEGGVFEDFAETYKSYKLGVDVPYEKAIFIVNLRKTYASVV